MIMKHFVYLLMEQNKNHLVVFQHVVLFFRFSMLMKVRIVIPIFQFIYSFYLGAILDIQFSTFYFPPPEGYDRILLEKSLI
jgi:hypothetical protein